MTGLFSERPSHSTLSSCDLHLPQASGRNAVSWAISKSGTNWVALSAVRVPLTYTSAKH